MTATAAIETWFASHGWEPFAFQREVWSAYRNGESGMIHSATGTGKSYAAWIGPVIEALLGELEDRHGSQLPLKEDNYWWIDESDIYSMERAPNMESVGQLYDDLDDLIKIAEGTDDALIFMLTRMSTILRYLGETYVV